MKKLFFSFLVFILLFFGITKSAVAASQVGPWYNQSFQEWSTKVYDTSNPQEIFGERYTAAQVQWVIYGLVSLAITGGDKTMGEVLNCTQTGDMSECLEPLITTLEDAFGGSGEEGTEIENNSENPPGQLILFNTISKQPMSGIGYLKSLISKFSLTPNAQAQGFGFEANNFSLQLWRVTRDISYALLTIVIVAVSFMIMFRIKISPQAVISIQTALPKIILAMILITFSYAIAGFLIDLMYVVLGLIATLLTSSINPLTTMNWGDLYSEFVNGKILWLLVKYYIGAGNLFAKASVNLPLAGLLYIVFIILFVVSSVKIIILLIKNFIGITFQTILAPFRILLGTFVQGEGFGPWLKNMAALLVIYPVISLMLFLAFFFLRQGWGQFPDWLNGGMANFLNGLFTFQPVDLTGSIAWTPPFTTFVGRGASVLPGPLSAMDKQAGFLFFILSYGIIHLIPKTAEIIKAVMQRKEYSYGSAIGESMGFARKGVGMAQSTSIGLDSYFKDSGKQNKLTSIIHGLAMALKWIPK